MKNKFINKTHIEGFVYSHTLDARVSGPNSKNPGTPFIMGNLDIATDDALTNIVSVHFTYVTATTKAGGENATYKTLKQIIDGELGSVMGNGAENAARIRIDSNVGVNDFYSDRSGTEELVSAKRNDGGFVHANGPWNDNENERNTFDMDILILGVRHVDADEERNLPEECILKGYTFDDFRKSLIPVELNVIDGISPKGAMGYFESLDISEKNPVFTELRGNQISTTVVRKVVEESAFGEPSVREVPNSRKKWAVMWAKPEPYDWDDESTLTVAELKDMITTRNTYLATVKQRNDEYKASKGKTAAAPSAFTVAKGDFKF